MKLRYWLIIWSALLVICLASGFSTRASYTKLSTDQEAVQSSYYMYSDSEKISDTDADTLSGMSQLVVTCRFTGKRRLQNQCCLSEVQVIDVIKGKQDFKTKLLRIYESVKIEIEKTSYFTIGNDYAQIVDRFNWAGKSNVIVSRPLDSSTYTLMTKGQTYLLFLNPKQNPAGMNQSGESKYILAESPFAKIAINSVSAAKYAPPAELISLKESLQYEILLTDASDIQKYFSTKEKILSQLHLI